MTGCYHACQYCYAAGIAERFGSAVKGTGSLKKIISDGDRKCFEVTSPYKRENGTNAPYPFMFDPTLHRYLLDKPQTWKKPRNIFVGSMCDLFGDWVPDDWIRQVFDAAARAPQHRYLFLTKNPNRYMRLIEDGELPPEHWYGETQTRGSYGAYPRRTSIL